METAGRATPQQVAYLGSLLANEGFTTLAQRNGYLSRTVKREIHYPDEVTKAEASKLINELEERRDRDKSEG